MLLVTCHGPGGMGAGGTGLSLMSPTNARIVPGCGITAFCTNCSESLVVLPEPTSRPNTASLLVERRTAVDGDDGVVYVITSVLLMVTADCPSQSIISTIQVETGRGAGSWKCTVRVVVPWFGSLRMKLCTGCRAGRAA